MAQLRIQRKKSGGGGDCLQVIFKSSQTYTIEGNWKSMDAFLVGGGGNAGQCGGYSSSTGNAEAWGGRGGRGGETRTVRLVNCAINKDLSVTIGGSNGDTRIELSGSQETITETALTGNGTAGKRGSDGGGAASSSFNTSRATSGGAGSNGYSDGTGPNGQGTTTTAFEENIGYKYAAGGGAGQLSVGKSGSTFATYSGKVGGVDGGGSIHGGAGAANSGSGGTANMGSVRWTNNNYNAVTSQTNGPLGYGGSGIVMIRLYKNNDRPTNIDWSDKTINL